MAVGGLTDLLMKIAEGKDAIFALPGSENCFDPTAQYGIDGVTEKVGKLTISLSFHCHFHTKKYIGSLICLKGKSMTPHRGNTILFRSSQQLPRLRLGPSKGFLS